MKSNHNLIQITTTLAIACLTISGQPVQAEKSVPEIGWSSRISSMGLDNLENIGEQYTFYCQPAEEDLIHSPVWGTTEYTVHSGICSTAVHSGMILPETGGEVTIKLITGKNFYTGSKKNNIISKDHRNADLSFTFVGNKKVKSQTQEFQSDHEDSQPSGIEKLLMDGLQRGVQKTIDQTINNLLN